MKHANHPSDPHPSFASCSDNTAQTVRLDDTDATVQAGQALGQALRTEQGLAVILFYGELGTGKTTFTRGLVSALPGGDEAEVASPSFTLCNSYPTKPPILHCDLYRSEGALPDEVDEALDEGAGLVLVEWAERLPKRNVPQERLDIRFQSCKNARSMTLTPHGETAGRVLQAFLHVQNAFSH